MACLIPIQYHKCRYPDDIKPMITEVAGHFDISTINVSGEYSLHTEYSFTGRKLNSPTVKKYSSICNAHKRGIPMLWYSEGWASEFADFILDLTKEQNAPRIIEIHPPFSDYSNIVGFIETYKIFEEKIKDYYPKVILLLENRSGTRYPGGDFIVSNVDQIKELCRVIDEREVDLKVTLDIPQLFTTHHISKCKIDLMKKLFMEMKTI